MPAQRVYLGLGANLGDPLAALRDAAARIAALPAVQCVAASSIWRSAPVESSGPDFLNAVMAIDTDRAPGDLLAALRAIETAHGRERPYRNAPRTLDLDLLLVDQRTITEPELEVPHPRMHLRRFVLAPLLEIAPDAVIPGRGPARAWLDQITDQPCTRTEHPLIHDH